MIIEKSTTVDLKLYQDQVINFLQSLTLKYTPNVIKYNNELSLKGYSVDEDDPTSWKYYMNLQGKYHETDTVMYIISLDTKSKIAFTVDNLNENPRTKLNYYPGSSYYKELVQQYPEQADLIKNIVYPVSDIQAAISSKDLTILGCDDSRFLEENEFYFIVDELQVYLYYLFDRWYMNFAKDETYYNAVFYAMMWYVLPMYIFQLRIKSIKTQNVHTWHVWQYLTSKGIDDYSDVLTKRQQMFLYRNMDYIITNRGKQHTLLVLIDNLLSEMGIGLYGRDVYQQTVDGADDALLIPEYVPLVVKSNSSAVDAGVSVDTTESLNAKLIGANIEVRDDAEWVNSVERYVGDTTINIFPTKFLEIRSLSRNKRFADRFERFMMETMLYMISNNQYNCDVQFVEPLTGQLVTLTAKEAVVLWNYTVTKSYGLDLDIIPNQCSVSIVFNKDTVDIPKQFNYDGWLYYFRTYVDTTKFTQRDPYINIKTPDQFTTLVCSLFTTHLNQWIQAYITNSFMERWACTLLTHMTTVRKKISMNLTDDTTYTKWFKNNYELYNSVVKKIDDSVEPKTAYRDISEAILGALVPTNEFMKQYGNFGLSSKGYERIRQLLIELTSYNITYLDSSSNRTLYLESCDSTVKLVEADFHDNLGMAVDAGSGLVLKKGEVADTVVLNIEDFNVTKIEPNYSDNYTIGQDITFNGKSETTMNVTDIETSKLHLNSHTETVSFKCNNKSKIIFKVLE